MPVDSQRKFVTKGFAFLLIQNRAFVFLPLFPPRRPLTLSVRRLSCVYSSIEEIPLSPRCPLQIFPLIFVNFRKFPSALEKKKIERKTRSNSKFLPAFFPPIDRNDFKRRRRKDVGTGWNGKDFELLVSVGQTRSTLPFRLFSAFHKRFTREATRAIIP